jgi:hypothetical protein
MTLAAISLNPLRWMRSAACVYAGFGVIVALTLVTEALTKPGGGLGHGGDLALRSAYAILGGYVAARFAPAAPLSHAMALATKGLLLGAVEAVTALQEGNAPPWFRVSMIAVAAPCAYLGGVLCMVRPICRR